MPDINPFLPQPVNDFTETVPLDESARINELNAQLSNLDPSTRLKQFDPFGLKQKSGSTKSVDGYATTRRTKSDKAKSVLSLLLEGITAAGSGRSYVNPFDKARENYSKDYQLQAPRIIDELKVLNQNKRASEAVAASERKEALRAQVKTDTEAAKQAIMQKYYAGLINAKQASLQLEEEKFKFQKKYGKNQDPYVQGSLRAMDTDFEKLAQNPQQAQQFMENLRGTQAMNKATTTAAQANAGTTTDYQMFPGMKQIVDPETGETKTLYSTTPKAVKTPTAFGQQLMQNIMQSAGQSTTGLFGQPGSTPQNQIPSTQLFPQLQPSQPQSATPAATPSPAAPFTPAQTPAAKQPQTYQPYQLGTKEGQKPTTIPTIPGPKPQAGNPPMRPTPPTKKNPDDEPIQIQLVSEKVTNPQFGNYQRNGLLKTDQAVLKDVFNVTLTADNFLLHDDPDNPNDNFRVNVNKLLPGRMNKDARKQLENSIASATALSALTDLVVKQYIKYDGQLITGTGTEFPRTLIENAPNVGPLKMLGNAMKFFGEKSLGRKLDPEDDAINILLKRNFIDELLQKSGQAAGQLERELVASINPGVQQSPDILISRLLALTVDANMRVRSQLQQAAGKGRDIMPTHTKDDVYKRVNAIMETIKKPVIDRTTGKRRSGYWNMKLISPYLNVDR